jgi:hypothetical protein
MSRLREKLGSDINKKKTIEKTSEQDEQKQTRKYLEKALL